MNQPGPELDAKLAKALGKPNVRKFNYRYVWDNVGYVNGKHVGAVMGTVDVPEYSTTWSGMQLVVEEMQRRNWWIVLNNEGDKWSALFYWNPNAEAFEGESDTAPHAVALAAKAALE